MNISALNTILGAMGFNSNSDIEGLSITEHFNGVQISFGVVKTKDLFAPIKSEEFKGNIVKSEPKSYDDIFKPSCETPKDYVVPTNESSEHKETFGEFCKKYEKHNDTSKDGTDEDDYIKSRNRSVWKTPVPGTRLRYVYFKSKPDAEKFIESYKDDFEITKNDRQKGEYQPYVLKNNTTENDLFTLGYNWMVSFRMNGADFEVLENCEGLKRNPKGKAGGHSVRIKE